jgi:outer membrane biosynthesis protein TonB
MPRRRAFSLLRLGAALAVVLLYAGCTPGGQFDPTEIINSEALSTKKKLQGEREPLFPNGVPGAETGVPPELVKGYQAPPEPAPEEAAAKATQPQAKAEAKPKPKPKPKPKVATAPPPTQAPHDPAFDQAAPAAPRAAQPQTAWPAPSTAQPGQTAWPNPPQAASGPQNSQPGQSVWPNPPSATH